MTKFPFFVKTIHNIKRPVVPPPLPASPYEKVIDYENLKEGYRKATRGQRKYTREAVKYDLFREKNNVDLWRELKSSRYTPGPYHFAVITEPKRRDLSIPKLRDKVVQLVIHEELQNIFRPVFIDRDTFDKLTAIREDDYRAMLAPCMDNEAVDAAVSRLKDAQRHAARLEREHRVVEDWAAPGIKETYARHKVGAKGSFGERIQNGFFTRDFLTKFSAIL